MGSDMYMNPPQKQWERHTVDSEEEAMEWVVGAMANDFEVNVSRNGSGHWIVSIFKGEWI